MNPKTYDQVLVELDQVVGDIPFFRDSQDVVLEFLPDGKVRISPV